MTQPKVIQQIFQTFNQLQGQMLELSEMFTDMTLVDRYKLEEVKDAFYTMIYTEQLAKVSLDTALPTPLSNGQLDLNPETNHVYDCVCIYCENQDTYRSNPFFSCTHRDLNYKLQEHLYTTHHGLDYELQEYMDNIPYF